jgi:hypothetical protein
VFFIDKNQFMINMICVMSTLLNTILPPSLRSLHNDYYIDNNQCKRFAVISLAGLTGIGFEVRVGVWSSTSPPNPHRNNEVTIILYKEAENPTNCHGHFNQEAANMLREDEFKWLLWSIQCIGNHLDLVGSAAAGNRESGIIYTYLMTLAKKFEVDARSIFDYLWKLTEDTAGTIDTTALLQKPW